MEAMNCGKPAIVTSVVDAFSTGKADLLAESIIYLAENPESRRRMGEINVRKMKEYDWDKIVKQYYALTRRY